MQAVTWADDTTAAPRWAAKTKTAMLMGVVEAGGSCAYGREMLLVKPPELRVAVQPVAESRVIDRNDVLVATVSKNRAY